MRRIFLFATCVLLSACGLLDPDDGGNVAVRFAVASTSGSASSLTAFSTTSGVGAQALRVEGRNGSLLIDRVVLIVDELELKGDGDACGGDDDDDSGPDNRDDDDDDDRDRKCKFEAEPFLLDLPVDGSPITIASDLIPIGIYEELEFEIQDVELDEHEDDDDRVLGLLAAEIRARFPEWPRRASALLEGTFQPVGAGTPRPFRVFLDAELEIEMDLVPPLVISDDGPSRVITVEVHPELWFRRIDGSVIDLSLFDFERTGRVIGVDLFERGFRHRHGDDD